MRSEREFYLRLESDCRRHLHLWAASLGAMALHHDYVIGQIFLFIGAKNATGCFGPVA
jgi:hypothetical protein